MNVVAIDTEYDYVTPFLATSTDQMMKTTVYRLGLKDQHAALRRLCHDPNTLKIFHNIVADKSRLLNLGIVVRKPYGCTMSASSLVNENYKPRALKKLVRQHLNIETKESNKLRSVITKYKAQAKKEGRLFKWSDIPDDVIIPYAKKDPEYTIQLWYYFQEPLARVQQLYDFEMSLVPMLVKIHQRGLRVDRTFVAKMVKDYSMATTKLQKTMSEYVYKKCRIADFNPGSPQQVGKVLLAMKIATDGITKTGLPKTDKDTLLQINHPFTKLLNEWRFYDKHNKTYYKPLLQRYTSSKNDIAHFDLYQAGAKTGRFSAELIQTFPRPEEDILRGKTHVVRRAIIPRKGKTLVCIDYRQIEMWLFIHYANCERLIDVASRWVDVYLETANLLFEDLMYREELRKALRKVAKTIALGLIYGMGIGRLIISLVHEMSMLVSGTIIRELGISRTWASQVLKRFYEIYPVRQFSHELISEVYKKGYLELSFESEYMNFNRFYHVPADLAYKAPNAKIQGTAAYIIKHAMKRCQTLIETEGWDDGGVDILTQVHDELIFEVDDSLELKPVVRKLCLAMEDTKTFKVPIYTEPKVSRVSWADVKTLEVFKNPANRKELR